MRTGTYAVPDTIIVCLSCCGRDESDIPTGWDRARYFSRASLARLAFSIQAFWNRNADGSLLIRSKYAWGRFTPGAGGTIWAKVAADTSMTAATTSDSTVDFMRGLLVADSK